MEALLVKILATALALSQVTVTPHAAKTEFSRERDQQQVAELLQAGCTHMIKAFEIENINLDDLIDTAMDDPRAFGGENKEFRGVNFADLQTAYRQFCKHQPVERPVMAARLPLYDVHWTPEAHVAHKDPLSPPSSEARQQLSCKSTDVESEGRRSRGGEAISECFRLDEHGRVLDTRHRLVPRERNREDRAKESEPASVFQSQPRAFWNSSPWQTAPRQAVPQWGSTFR
jgi:hypothetical protein